MMRIFQRSLQPRRAALRHPFNPRRFGAAVGGWLFGILMAYAEVLPDVSDLERSLDLPAQTITVIEPHLSTVDHAVKADYVGWPAVPVLDVLFGAAWKEKGVEVEFRALDGYVSHIPSERFDEYRAFMAYRRADRKPFVVDNLEQGETSVPLGPYYLVWDNIRDAGLLPYGAIYWPYQVSEVRLSHAWRAALLPGEMAERYTDEAALARKYCLSCHNVNGYGGVKWPSDLAQQTKTMSLSDFERWVLTPTEADPGTTMPPLPEQIPLSEREDLARRLYYYLSAH